MSEISTSILFFRCTFYVFMSSYFPFDEQNCIIRLELEDFTNLFSYLDYQLPNLTANSSSFVKYIRESEEWTITNYEFASDSDLVHLFNQNSPTNWTLDISHFNTSHAVLVNMTLSRRSSYFVYNLIAPLLVIVSLAVSVVAVPSNAHNKPELLIAILVAFTLYQLLLAENSPKTDSVPLLGLFITSSLVLCGVDIFLVCLIIYLHHLGEKRAPKLLCIVFIRPIRFCLTVIKKGLGWLSNRLVCRNSVNLMNGTNINIRLFNSLAKRNRCNVTSTSMKYEYVLIFKCNM